MKLILLGDMAFFGCCSITTNEKAEEYFAEVADYLESADYVVGNLETPFSITKKTSGAKSAYICSDVENVKLLKLLHINAVTLANNHMFDFGKEGYETTKRVLKENGIDFFGCEGKNLLLDLKGNKLAFEGFCCFSTNPLCTVPYGDYGVNEYNVQKAEETLSKHESEGRLPILAVHAGLEHVNFPSLDHVKAARYLSKNHDYVYYGHHPHVSQGLELSDGSLIAYSLGNFCFDDVWSSVDTQKPLVELTENNRNSFLLEIEIETNKIVSYKIVPFYIGKDRLTFSKGTTEAEIKEYTQKIDMLQTEEYVAMRRAVLSARAAERKKQRNISWYLRRLRPRYFELILTTKENAKKYRNNLKIQ